MPGNFVWGMVRPERPAERSETGSGGREPVPSGRRTNHAAPLRRTVPGLGRAYRHMPLHGDLTFMPVAVSELVLQSRANLGNMLGMLAG